jgi:DUF1009 family protein
MKHSVDPAPIGLLAAWGDYPLVVARSLREAGHRIVALGVRDHCDPRLATLVDEFHWIGLARLGTAARLFRRHGVSQATMAGKIHKVLLYRPWLWLQHTPDWLCLKTFYPHFVAGRRDRKDDTLLGAIVGAFASRGIEFVPATDFAPQLLATSGLLAGRPLTRRQQRDVQFGWQLAKAMGGLDVGQSVCVKNQAVMAIEAIEGTDACITRAGQLCRSGGFVVVKVAKPQQDMRFDVPTVGLRTLENMAAAGGTVLAIEASRTILLDGPNFGDTANRMGISVLAVDNAAADAMAAAA